MNSYIGYSHPFHSKDNVNYTRGYILDYVPYFLFGAEALYPVTDSCDNRGLHRQRIHLFGSAKRGAEFRIAHRLGDNVEPDCSPEPVLRSRPEEHRGTILAILFRFDRGVENRCLDRGRRLRHRHRGTGRPAWKSTVYVDVECSLDCPKPSRPLVAGIPPGILLGPRWPDHRGGATHLGRHYHRGIPSTSFCKKYRYGQA